MRICCGFLALAVGVVFAARASAQPPSVVQLPSFSFFTVDTTVSVPDRGTASLGGIGRSSTGSTAFGPALGPANRGFGSSMSANSVSVRASVHDFDALDRTTLNQAARGSGNSRAAKIPRGRAPRPPAAPGSSAQRVPPGSVAEARRLHAAEAAAEEAAALSDLERARAAAAKGKTSVAKVLYKMALRRAPGKLKSQIHRELLALSNP